MKPSIDEPMTARLPADLTVQLEKLIQDIEQSIAEADRGEFASAGEVNSFFAKYGG